jgi:superfamily II DNA or RNA helicase
MPTKIVIPLKLNFDSQGELLSGVGPGIGIKFIQTYFPKAQNTIRIASVYFTLQGYNVGNSNVNENVSFKILVGKEDGKNVQEAVLKDVADELKTSKIELSAIIENFIEKIKNGKILIRDARAIKTPFHCKFYICDDELMWHGSANYSINGLKTNSEQVSVIFDLTQITSFSEWFDEVASISKDLLEELLLLLESWLNLHNPFDVYLKALLLLSDKISSNSKKSYPTYFQQGIILNALRQSEEYGGSLIVVATGLGKTIIGAEIAYKLQASEKSNMTVLFAPINVHKEWKKEFRERNINHVIFNIQLLFKKPSENVTHKIYDLDEEFSQMNEQTVIIIDEVHFFKNQEIKVHLEDDFESEVYKRILPIVKGGAKIFLLTATPFATHYQNLNSLLKFLPHNSTKAMLPDSPWEVSNTVEFVESPVVNILGLPHVIKMSKDRDDVDENGKVFIDFAGKRKYLPDVIELMSIRYELFLHEQIKDISKYFTQKDKGEHNYLSDQDSIEVSKSFIDSLYSEFLTGWLSSPDALEVVINKNLQTPDVIENGDINDNSQISMFQDKSISSNSTSSINDEKYKIHLKYSQELRIKKLSPILELIRSQNLLKDDKLRKLKEIIDERHILGKSKVIIFINRNATFKYIKDSLNTWYGNDVLVDSTIGTNYTLKNAKERTNILRRFSPESHKEPNIKKEFDILICTDADNVGVNLQDADTLINYDVPKTADSLFQRAGRIFRMTDKPGRRIYFYTLVPNLIDKPAHLKIHSDIKKRFERLANRHGKTQTILGTIILSNEDRKEIFLSGEEFLKEIVDEKVLKSIGGEYTETLISQTTLLEKNKDFIKTLPDFVHSTMNYSSDEVRVFLVIKFNGKYISILYNSSLETIEEKIEIEKLKYISCNKNTEKALIKASEVEHESLKALQKWCEIKKVNFEEETIEKICAMLLVPKRISENQTIKDFLGINIKEKKKYKG